MVFKNCLFVSNELQLMREYCHNSQFLSDALSVATNLKELDLAGDVDESRSPDGFTGQDCEQQFRRQPTADSSIWFGWKQF